MSVLRGGWRVGFPHHDAGQLFAVAVDIESYPRFIPWCRLARVCRRDGNVLEVDNVFGAGPVQARFRSRAELDPPHHLDITASDGPFRRFHLGWSFEPGADGGCRVVVEYRMAFRSPLLASLAQISQPDTERRAVQAFKERVRVVYGP